MLAMAQEAQLLVVVQEAQVLVRVQEVAAVFRCLIHGPLFLHVPVCSRPLDSDSLWTLQVMLSSFLPHPPFVRIRLAVEEVDAAEAWV